MLAKNRGSAKFISQWSAAIFLPILHFFHPEVNTGNSFLQVFTYISTLLIFQGSTWDPFDFLDRV